MRCAGRGPRIFSRAEKPDGIGGEAGGLGRAGDEDGRVLQIPARRASHRRRDRELPENLSNSMRRPSKPSEAQSSTVCCQRLRAWNSALVSGRAPGQPATSKQLRHELGPGERSLRAACEIHEAALGLRHARDPVGRQRLAGVLAKELRERPARALQILRRSARMKAVSASDSSGEPANWPVERSQSSSCSSIGLLSQWSSRPALRARAILLSGTPSENSRDLQDWMQADLGA